MSDIEPINDTPVTPPPAKPRAKRGSLRDLALAADLTKPVGDEARRLLASSAENLVGVTVLSLSNAIRGRIRMRPPRKKKPPTSDYGHILRTITASLDALVGHVSEITAERDELRDRLTTIERAFKGKLP